MPDLCGVITGLDHLVLICPDIEDGIARYTAVFGRGADWVSLDQAGGVATAQFRTENSALELMAPAGEGPVGQRLGELLEAGGPRLTSLVFLSQDLDVAHHDLTRRGLAPGEISSGRARHQETGELRSWRRFRCADAACAGVKTFILQHDTPPAPPVAGPGQVARLDHLVITTPNPERAVALYGARLGLRFALDRTAEQWGTRFLFFRTGGLTLEVIHRLGEAPDPAESDQIWGLTWAVEDLEAAHARLSAQNADISPIRPGRKPGTRVFTLRRDTLGVPTLFIVHEPG
ncbi:MAG: VOC family protein [Hyphomonadaceae bacterium]|nr:VOC family protein [Hyphomonadaceae bacterium]